MKYFLEFVISTLVDHSEEVDIEQVETSRAVIYYVRIHPQDIGKLIGKNGRTISAIRSVLNSAARDHRKVQVEVVEDFNSVPA